MIRIYRDEDAAKSGAGDAYISETLVTNVRVLAIGQNAQDKGGQPFAAGTTATLELDPRQAESVILSQRVGQLSLVLRAMQDSAKQATTARKRSIMKTTTAPSPWCAPASPPNRAANEDPAAPP